MQVIESNYNNARLASEASEAEICLVIKLLPEITLSKEVPVEFYNFRAKILPYYRLSKKILESAKKLISATQVLRPNISPAQISILESK